jgi:D-alanyl-D-alanine dipeptidase
MKTGFYQTNLRFFEMQRACPYLCLMKKMLLLLLIGSCAWYACQNEPPAVKPPTTVAPEPAPTKDTLAPTVPEHKTDSIASEISEQEKASKPKPTVPIPSKISVEKSASAPAPTESFNAEFTDIKTLTSTIRLDIRYATTNNFTKSKIYDCPRCLLRPEPARAIATAHAKLQKQGLGLKMFDCYRPRPYQQRLWDKVPNPDYVTPPAKGSMHSRGAAVDLTIVDAQGNELPMGTPYDFFGVEAHTDYTKLSAEVLKNRELLRKTMEEVGFKGIRTEWWHFSFQRKDFALSSYVWPCRD